MKIEDLKSKLELLQIGVNEKKAELVSHLETEATLDTENKDSIEQFEQKTATLMEEISTLEETATKEYNKFKAVNPVTFNLGLASKSVDGGNTDTSSLEELLTSLSVKTQVGKYNGVKKSIGTYLAEYVVKGLGVGSEDDFERVFGNTIVPFRFQLADNDNIAEAEVKSLPQIKTLYTNGGTQLMDGITPVPGFQGYGCSVVEIEDACMPCIEPRNFRDLLTVRNMPAGSILQYEYPVSRDDNAASVLEHVHNPYPTVFQNGQKPESTFTYNTAKVSLSKIAHWIEATDDVLDDCSKVAERIDFHLTSGLVNEVDRQLIAGTGSNGELLGLLLQPGKLTLNGTTLTAGISTPNIWDKLYMAMLELDQNCAKVDGVIINPADRAKVALAKDDNGNYLFPQGNTCDLNNNTVGCLTLRTSPDVPVGTAIIGEFRNNWIYYVRKALEIRVGLKGNDFIQNNKTFLAEIRGAALLRCPEKMATVSNI